MTAQKKAQKKAKRKPDKLLGEVEKQSRGSECDG